eukprot:512581_1
MSVNKRKKTQSKTTGQKKQMKQGIHGWQGGEIGSITGASSKTSPQYIRYRKRQALGVLEEHEKPGRPTVEQNPDLKNMSAKERQQIKERNKRPFSYMNFSKQIYFAGVYNKIRAEQGFTGKPLLEAAKKYCKKQNIENKFIELYESPPGLDKQQKKNRKNGLRKQLNRILVDEPILKVAVGIGEGEQINFHPPTKPTFDYEAEIEEQIGYLISCGKRYDAVTITTIAMQCAFNHGYQVKMEKKDDELFSEILLKDFYDDMNAWIHKNNEENAQNEDLKVISFGPHWRVNLMKRMKHKYSKVSNTSFNEVEFLSNIVPFIVCVNATKMTFDIPSKVGRIHNGDQTMFARFGYNDKTWHPPNKANESLEDIEQRVNRVKTQNLNNVNKFVEDSDDDDDDIKIKLEENDCDDLLTCVCRAAIENKSAGYIGVGIHKRQNERRCHSLLVVVSDTAECKAQMVWNCGSKKDIKPTENEIKLLHKGGWAMGVFKDHMSISYDIVLNMGMYTKWMKKFMFPAKWVLNNFCGDNRAYKLSIDMFIYIL